MNKLPINKEKVIQSVIKLVSDKNAVRSYMKGKTSMSQLIEKGIKFAKPL